MADQVEFQTEFCVILYRIHIHFNALELHEVGVMSELLETFG